MPKETLGYVKLEWTCPGCGSKNPGPEPKCLGCGAPQPEDVEFEQMAEEKLLTDEAEIARAKASPDVHCAYCGARNRAGAAKCVQCGASLGEGRKRASGRVVGAHRSRKAADVPCPACGASNPATARKCSQCGSSMAQPKRVARRSTQVTKSRAPIGCLIAIAAVLILVVVFFILSSRTHDVVGRVEAVYWERSIGVEALGPVAYEDWRSDVPADADLLSCSQKVHHTQDQPTGDSQQVCGTPYTVDTGSGYGEVVQDCEYQVYDDWCQYTLQEWQEVDRVALEGDDLSPRWPALNLRAGQREGERQEKYQVLFDADGKDYTYTTSDVERFTRCKVGSRWTLKVNALGGIAQIDPAK